MTLRDGDISAFDIRNIAELTPTLNNCGLKRTKTSNLTDKCENLVRLFKNTKSMVDKTC